MKKQKKELITGSSSLDKTKRQKIKPIIINPMSDEQNLLGSMFGNGDKVLTGGDDSLPKLNGSLMPNQFDDKIENDDVANTFGFGKNKQRTGLF